MPHCIIRDLSGKRLALSSPTDAIETAKSIATKVANTVFLDYPDADLLLRVTRKGNVRPPRCRDYEVLFLSMYRRLGPLDQATALSLAKTMAETTSPPSSE